MSDEFDDGDDLFSDPNALQVLDRVEAEAKAVVSASQMPRYVGPAAMKPHGGPRQGGPYHHTVSAPRPTQQPGPSRPGPPAAPFGRRKDGTPRDPAPLNVMPGAVAGGFGWEHGGKRSMDENKDRFVAAVNNRQAYWGTNVAYHPDTFKSGRDEDDYPDITVDPTGRYGMGRQDDGLGEGEVVDSLNQPISESLVVGAHNRMSKKTYDPRTAQARRAAIAAVLDKGSAVMTGQNGQTGPSAAQGENGKAEQIGMSRPFARSVSAGSHLASRPAHSVSAGPSRLKTIPSEEKTPDSSQVSGSQSGSLARRLHLDLEEEKKRREALEIEVAKLRGANVSRRRSEPEDQFVLWKEREVEEDEETSEGKAAIRRQLDALQKELYTAQGKVATMERNRERDISNIRSEAERYALRIKELEAAMMQKDKDHKVNLEQLRSQAIFNNHAAHSSVARGRMSVASQRYTTTKAADGYTPIQNGSPSRRGHGEAVPLIQSVKGKAVPIGKAAAAPAFSKFVNAFDNSPASRTKRQRTEGPAASPTTSPSKGRLASQNGMRTPEPSPTKQRGTAEAMVLGADEIEVGDIVMESDSPRLQWDAALETNPAEEPPDRRVHLIFLLLNYVDVPLYGSKPSSQPAIYRILHYQPLDEAVARVIYESSCGELLRACGDASMTFEDVVNALAAALTRMLGVFHDLFRSGSEIGMDDLSAVGSLLALTSRAAFSFPDLVHAFLDLTVLSENGLDATYMELVESILQLDQIASLQSGLEYGTLQACVSDLVALAIDLAEALCIYASPRVFWRNQTLSSIILFTTDSNRTPAVINQGVDLFYLASCFPSFFREIIGADNQNVVDRLARLLANPPKAPAELTLRILLSTIRGFSMLTVADRNAVVLVSERSVLVPCLIQLLQRESSKVWGINSENHSIADALCLLHPALLLLHHLAYPTPYTRPAASSTQSDLTTLNNQRLLSAAPDAETESEDLPQAANLAARMAAVNTSKEFNGIQHCFQAALGAIAYADIDLDALIASQMPAFGAKSPSLADQVVEGTEDDASTPRIRTGHSNGFRGWPVTNEDLRSIQCLGQDILEAVLEGPEVDALYEMYAETDEEGDTVTDDAAHAGGRSADAGYASRAMGVQGVHDDVDPDAYAAAEDEADHDME